MILLSRVARAAAPKIVIALLIGFCTAGAGRSQEPMKISLAQAIELALKNNHNLVIAAGKVEELHNATRVAVSNYYPRLTNSSSYVHFTQTDVLHFSPGSFGSFPGVGPLPASSLTVAQGEVNNEISRTQIAQPLTQLIRIHDGHRVAQAEERAGASDMQALRNRVALIVRGLYYGLLTEQLDSETASKALLAAQQHLIEAKAEINKESALEVTLIGAKASVLQAKQTELMSQLRRSDLEAEFDEVVGLQPGTRLELDNQVDSPSDLPDKQECIRIAQSSAPGIRSAEETVRKAQAAVAAARTEYIPDVSFFARHDYQNGVPFLFHNYGIVGISLDYTIFDGGKKAAMVREREAQRAQALENLRRVKDEAGVNVDKAWNKMQQSKSLIDVASQTVALREEADRLADVRLRYATILNAERLEAVSDLAKARADLLKAQLAYVESEAELEVIIGRLPK